MRHRMGIASLTGLGNSSKELLPNNWTEKDRNKLNPMLKEAVELFFKKWGYCDLFIKENSIDFGIEPAYQFEELRIVSIKRNKEKSFIEYGKAWGLYGSEIVRNTKYYEDYKKNGKFKRFIDKWYPTIFGGAKPKNGRQRR